MESEALQMLRDFLTIGSDNNRDGDRTLRGPRGRCMVVSLLSDSFAVNKAVLVNAVVTPVRTP
jgi:hypothetical protein